MRSDRKLKQALRSLLKRGGERRQVAGVDTKPGCAFGTLIEQRLSELERTIKGMKLRLLSFTLMLLSAVAAEIATRLLG